MKANYETGDGKNIANFEKLITKCISFGPRYNPAPPDLTIDAMNKQYAGAGVVFDKFITAERIAIADANLRRVLFKDMKKFSTRIVNSLASAGVTKETITNANGILRKIRGVRATGDAPPATTEAGTPEPAKKKNSVSQQSFDMLIQHFSKLLELLLIEPRYQPNEADLTSAALENYKQEMKIFNKKAGVSEANRQAAAIARDLAVYGDQTGVVPIAQRAKNYIVSVFGASSPEAKQADKIRFRNKPE